MNLKNPTRISVKVMFVDFNTLTPMIGAIVAEMAIKVLYIEMIVVLFSLGVTSKSILNKKSTVPVMDIPIIILKKTKRTKDVLKTYKIGVILIPNVAITMESVYPYLSENLPQRLAVSMEAEPEAIEIAESQASFAFR